MLRHLLNVFALLVATALIGCGGDDDPPPTTPPGPAPPTRTCGCPRDYPTIVDALAAAFQGDGRTVSLAAGDYTVDASLDHAVSLRCRPGQAGLVRLLDSRLTVRADTDTVTLHGLVLAGDDTLLSVPGAATVLVDSCRIQDAVLGILHTGGGALTLRDTRITQCNGSGALHAHGTARLQLHRTTIDQCTAGETGVIHATGATNLSWHDVSLASCTADQAVLNLTDTTSGEIDGLMTSFCTPYTVRHRGGALTVRDAWFQLQAGTSVAVGAGSTLTLDACRFLQCVWPVVEVGGTAEIWSTVVFDGAGPGPAWLVGDGGTVSAANCTVHRGAGPLLPAGRRRHRRPGRRAGHRPGHPPWPAAR